MGNTKYTPYSVALHTVHIYTVKYHVCIKTPVKPQLITIVETITVYSQL